VLDPKVDLGELKVSLENRYASLQCLRAGGQGVVFSARRILNHRKEPVDDYVALKIHSGTTENVRVDREIAALRGFDHPCLASLVEHGMLSLNGEQYRYVAWRFIHGIALDERLKSGPVSAKTVACVGRDVARAIDHIWQKRIVHRDINPKNIMLSPREDSAILIDLGVARFLDLQVLTAAGRTWGTPGYFSPEQWCGPGENLTCYSDVFALGISLQEALIGRHPTGGDQRSLLNGRVPTASLCPTTSAMLATIIDECLHVRAAFRPAPSVLAQELARLAAQLN
jgi:serine/threonine protein kinase